MTAFREILSQVMEQYGQFLQPKQEMLFIKYYQLLIEWNNKFNLTAITDPREVVVKHFIDSISCLTDEFFPAGCKIIDVGTGAGFPGIPLKIVRPDLQLTLVDSLLKRVGFLEKVVTELSLDSVSVIHSRSEDIGQQAKYREQFQVVCARAVAKLNVLAELCLPLLVIGGTFVVLKGLNYQEEILQAGNALKTLGGTVDRVVPVKLPGIDDRRAVIYIKKERQTPERFPRRAGIPEKKPL